MASTRALLAAGLVALAASLPAAAAGPVATASSTIVLRGELVRFEGLTAVYRSARGTYRATWTRAHHYRLRGRVGKRRLRGTFTTRQVSGRASYRATGSGRLGARYVRIGGGGPNDLKTSRLVLR
jgi:hypothetical protein